MNEKAIIEMINQMRKILDKIEKMVKTKEKGGKIKVI